MFKCKVCGRDFKSKSALGGHVSTAHKRTGEDAQAQAASPPTAPVQLPGELVVSDTAEGKAEQIRSYLRGGLHLRAADRYIWLRGDDGAPRDSRGCSARGRKDSRGAPTDGIPVTRRAGSGVDVLDPEAVPC